MTSGSRLPRIAAAADVHVRADGRPLFSDIRRLHDDADVLLLAGDLTCRGRVDEGAALARWLREVEIPTVAVLGNHDYHSGCAPAIVRRVQEAGVRLLSGDAAVFDVGGATIGVAGATGFGGGFGRSALSGVGEPEMQAFVDRTRREAELLEEALRGLDCDFKIALLHYSPTRATLHGEPPELFAALGSDLLGDAADRGGADVVVHGHAHNGSAFGRTAAGVPVFNVARQVVGRDYELLAAEALPRPRARSRGIRTWGRAPAERVTAGR